MERGWLQLAPRKQVGEIAAVAVDMVRSRRELVLENAVLRHQVHVLRRGNKRRKLALDQVDVGDAPASASSSPSVAAAIADLGVP